MVDLSCETNSTQTIPMQSKEKAVFNAIKCHFTCDIRRVKFISCLIISLLKLNDCSLNEWSKGICVDVLLSSKYKRLQRLLCSFQFGQLLYFELVWSAYGQSDQVVLTLDRTAPSARRIQAARPVGADSDAGHRPPGHEHPAAVAHQQPPGQQQPFGATGPSEGP